MNWLFDMWGMTNDNVTRALDETTRIIMIILNAFLGLLGLAAALFFVWVGFKLAKAEDESKRKEAKKQMLFAIVAIIGVVVLIVLWNLVIVPAINSAETPDPCAGPNPPPGCPSPVT